MTRVIAILNWDRHQHYKDRDPPWIKLYRDLLSAESWVLGTDDSRLVQVASTLLAARYHNATPLNFALFRKVASLDMTEARFMAALRHLEQTKFLEIQGESDTREQSASKSLATCTSEAEQSREEGEKSREEQCPAERDDSAVERVFDHWKSVHGHQRSKLDGKRKKAIKAALALYPADELCEAISGYLNSPHHMGMNDRGTKYDDIELFLRDAKRIDAGLEFARNPPSNVSTLTRKIIANTEDWVPPEMRRGTA